MLKPKRVLEPCTPALTSGKILSLPFPSPPFPLRQVKSKVWPLAELTKGLMSTSPYLKAPGFLFVCFFAAFVCVSGASPFWRLYWCATQTQFRSFPHLLSSLFALSTTLQSRSLSPFVTPAHPTFIHQGKVQGQTVGAPRLIPSVWTQGL